MDTKHAKKTATAFAILAAALYAVNVPLSKLLLKNAGPTMMAAFLYLGAGLGMFLYSLGGRALGREVIKEPLTRKELPYTAAMVLLDIAAPILLMLGIQRTSSANVSLLNNFEIVATSLIAFFVYRERISKRLCAAIVLVVAASVLLGVAFSMLLLGERPEIQFYIAFLIMIAATVMMVKDTLAEES